MAWIPIASSLAIILMELGFIAFFDIRGEQTSDEGIAAHLFQLWLVSQVIMVPLFALTWFPKNPWQALPITVSQVALMLIACFPVFYFGW